MIDFIKLVLGRIIGGIVASIAAWLTVHYGIIVTQSQQDDAISYVVGIMMLVFSILYPILHKWMNMKLNPGDTASSTLAAKAVMDKTILKGEEK